MDLAAGIQDLHRQTLPGQLEPDLVGILDWKDSPVGRDHPSIPLIKIKEAQVRKIGPTQVSPSNAEKRAPFVAVEKKSDLQGNLRSIAFQIQISIGEVEGVAPAAFDDLQEI
jgi:hypothetical protein